MFSKKFTRNYIDLISLKTSELLKNQNLNIILNDDIWDKDILIVKSGGYLTENLLNKLINFGVKKVSVNFSPEVKQTPDDTMLNEFTQTQNAIILDDKMQTSGWLVKNLLDTGLKKSNIFITQDYSSINKIFRLKKINFIFINSSFYEKCSKCVDKYSLLRNTHVFVIMEENESARKLRNSYNYDIKFLMKPLYSKRLKQFINQGLNQNFLDLHMEEEARVS